VDCEGELSEIEGFYRAMEAEVNAMLSADKQHNQRKLEGYYGEYLTAVDAFKELRISTQSAAKKNEATTSTRKVLVASNERLDQSTYSLQQAKQTVNETEQIGDTIVSDLENQREKLIGAGENVTETKSNTHTARRALNLISRRVLIQKIFLLILILLLFITMWVLLYYGLQYTFSVLIPYTMTLWLCVINSRLHSITQPDSMFINVSHLLRNCQGYRHTPCLRH
jgi:vesicle transport through interaction with t-SNAREs 1